MLNTFAVSLNSVFMIIVIMVIGFAIGKSHMVSADFANDLSNLVMNIALPISIFTSTQKYLTRSNFKILVIGLVFCMIALGLCWGISYFLVKVLHLGKKRRGLFINGIVNTNTLFVGMPLNLALLGQKSLPYFLAYFVASTIMTWGIGVKLIYKDGGITKAAENESLLKRILGLFAPPMWGFLIGLIFFMFNVKLPQTGFLFESFNYLANIVTPLSLIFLGLQVAKTKVSSFKLEAVDLWAQLGKFIINPLLMFLVLYVNHLFGWISLPTVFTKTLLVQSVTPMLTLLPMFAEQGHLDVDFSTRILTESIFIFPFMVVAMMLLLN